VVNVPSPFAVTNLQLTVQSMYGFQAGLQYFDIAGTIFFLVILCRKPVWVLWSTSSSAVQNGSIEQCHLTCKMICLEGQYYCKFSTAVTATLWEQNDHTRRKCKVEVLFIPLALTYITYITKVLKRCPILDWKNDLLNRDNYMVSVTNESYVRMLITSAVINIC
jgi:hypothetical protein